MFDHIYKLATALGQAAVPWNGCPKVTMADHSFQDWSWDMNVWYGWWGDEFSFGVPMVFFWLPW